MKQYITQEQVDSLSPKAHNKLTKWCIHHRDGEWPEDSYTLSLGEMIEFLGDKFMKLEFEVDMWTVNDYYNADEACDALWDICKEVLEK